VSEIHLNDKDLLVYSFWRSVLDHTDEFLSLLFSVSISVKTWRKQKRIIHQPGAYSTLERGFAAFFLNRCNHSGVFNAGPIGGLKQHGNYKIDARFNRLELARRIERIHLYRERIKISRLDGIRFLEKYFAGTNKLGGGCLVYLDPPYLAKAQRLYPLYFEQSDHTRLASYLNERAQFRWIISYDDATPIRKLYASRGKSITKSYCLHSARVGRELLISSRNCALPRQTCGNRHF
jgi:DNA adenine methylase